MENLTQIWIIFLINQRKDEVIKNFNIRKLFKDFTNNRNVTYRAYLSAIDLSKTFLETKMT